MYAGASGFYWAYVEDFAFLPRGNLTPGVCMFVQHSFRYYTLPYYFELLDFFPITEKKISSLLFVLTVRCYINPTTYPCSFLHTISPGGKGSYFGKQDTAESMPFQQLKFLFVYIPSFRYF